MDGWLGESAQRAGRVRCVTGEVVMTIEPASRGDARRRRRRRRRWRVWVQAAAVALRCGLQRDERGNGAGERGRERRRGFKHTSYTCTYVALESATNQHNGSPCQYSGPPVRTMLPNVRPPFTSSSFRLPLQPRPIPRSAILAPNTRGHPQPPRRGRPI